MPPTLKYDSLSSRLAKRFTLTFRTWRSNAIIGLALGGILGIAAVLPIGPQMREHYNQRMIEQNGGVPHPRLTLEESRRQDFVKKEKN